MSRPRRRFAIAGFVIFGGFLALSITAFLWLRAWIPTKGKAWLEQQLEQEFPLDVTIQTMRYSLFFGFLLEEVRASDRQDASIVWFHAPKLSARIGLLGLLIRRQLAFRLEGALSAPCETHLLTMGSYRIRGRQLTMTVLTSEIQIDRLIPQLAQHLPPALKTGRVRLKARVNWQVGSEPIISGRLIGTRLLWEHDPIRIMGNVTVNGTAMPTPQSQTPLSLDLTALVEHVSLEGVPLFRGASEVSGTIRLVNETLTIQTLRGTTLGSPWEMEGTVALLTEPQADLFLRSRVDLAPVVAQMAEPIRAWQPNGEAELAIVCRGPLARWPDIELQASAVVREGSLSIPRVPHRLEHLTGRLQYDHLTKFMSIQSVSGQMRGYPVTLRGVVHLTTPAMLDLSAETTADLVLLKDVLPPDGPIQTVTGPVSVHLELGGIFIKPTWQAVATLTNANLLLRGFHRSVEKIHGTIRFSDQEASTPELAFTIDEQPIILTATVTELTTSPRFMGNARLAHGSLAASGMVQPDRVILETGELALGESRLHAQGEVSRLPQQASQLTLTGTLELSDLFQLPWVDLKGLEAWPLDGEAALQLRLVGPLDEWRLLAARGIVRADQLLVRNVPVQALSVELEQGQERLSIRVTNALAAGGRLSGEFLMQHETPPRYLLEFDLTRAELSQVAASIPAWRGRDIQGVLSTHASLIGLWKDRPSLRGQGWLHAEGERLADLPLLDRLLRGLFGVLADRLGLSTLRTAQITTLAGQWRLSQGRLFTDDLRLSGSSGAEPITIYVRGSVGLDKTLDLTIEPELSEQLVLQAPNTSALASAVLKMVGGLERLRRQVGRHHLTGTIDKPQYKFEFSLDQLRDHVIRFGVDQLLEIFR